MINHSRYFVCAGVCHESSIAALDASFAFSRGLDIDFTLQAFSRGLDIDELVLLAFGG